MKIIGGGDHGWGQKYCQLNGRVGGFRQWLFNDGMLFGDVLCWWSESLKNRSTPHEGIDLFSYQGLSVQGNLSHIMVGDNVPALIGGQVVAICHDFLGQSVFIAVEPTIILVMAHLEISVYIGSVVQFGTVVGQISPGNKVVPGHLHVSILEVKDVETLLSPALSWPYLLANKECNFVNPLSCLAIKGLLEKHID